MPGPGQVLVTMRAWSVNYRDLLVVTGQYNPRLKLPMVPLSDGAGEVTAVGPGVTRVKAGERVAGAYMQKWLAGRLTDDAAKSALGGAIDGVFAEQVLFSADGVVRIPEHLSFEEAATLPCAALTAWNALVATGGGKAGDGVLIQGPRRGPPVAPEIAKMPGGKADATSRSDAKLARRSELGA